MSEMFLHKCPNCNGTLEFNIESGMAYCSFCGSKFDVESLKTENGEKKPAKDAAPLKEFDWKEYKKPLVKEDLEGSRSYLCQTCGAEVILDAITASSQCPYCGNYLILTENVTAGLRPNGIIPFKIQPNQLAAAVRDYYKGRKLLPFNFFSDNKIGSPRGIYVPFWLYNCSIKGGMTLKGDKVSSYTDSGYRYTETSEYDLQREAEMNFERIPVDASLKMPDALMDSIEPFDYSQLT